MIEIHNSDFVGTFLNGAASESMPMIKLMGQVVVILFIGLFLWRISAAFSGKKVNRRSSVFNETGYQKHWRNRK